MDTKIAHDIDEKERTTDVIATEKIPFSQMLLADPVLKGLLKFGYQIPSPIQTRAIPLGKSGLGKISKIMQNYISFILSNYFFYRFDCSS